uniref:Uncharacterized protein n=1 Tax=Scophthalmus maximus TaxID=52904 RepID=A0A8D3A2X2_SCOMX
MAEDHGLGNSNGTVDVTEGLELLLLAVAQHKVLFDSIQRLLLSLQFDDVGVGHDALGKVPHGFFKCGRKQQHLAVFRQHPACLVQHKHLDLLGVDKLELTAPVQHSLHAALHWNIHKKQFDLGIVLAHLLDHFTGLKCQFIGGRHTQALTGQMTMKEISGLVI